MAGRRAIIKDMERNGFMLLRGKKHLVFQHPSGAQIVTSATPSDWRAERKRERDIRHALRGATGEEVVSVAKQTPVAEESVVRYFTCTECGKESKRYQSLQALREHKREHAPAVRSLEPTAAHTWAQIRAMTTTDPGKASAMIVDMYQRVLGGMQIADAAAQVGISSGALNYLRGAFPEVSRTAGRLGRMRALSHFPEQKRRLNETVRAAENRLLELITGTYVDDCVRAIARGEHPQTAPMSLAAADESSMTDPRPAVVSPASSRYSDAASRIRGQIEAMQADLDALERAEAIVARYAGVDKQAG